MLNNTLITRCKRILRGESEGDKMVAMVALHKAGLTIPKTTMSLIRAEYPHCEEGLKAVYDIYDAIISFINRDRRGSLNEAKAAAILITERYNKHVGQATCKYRIGEKQWFFTVGCVDFEYTKNKYSQSSVDALVKFFAETCGDSAALLRIHTALNE